MIHPRPRLKNNQRQNINQNAQLQLFLIILHLFLQTVLFSVDSREGRIYTVFKVGDVAGRELETMEMEITLKFWSKGNIERVYASTTDGQPVGYFDRSRKMVMVPGLGMAQSFEFSFLGDANVGAAILGQIDQSVYGVGHFSNVSSVASGAPLISGVFGNTPKKEIAKIRKARDSRTFAIAA